jgi:thiol:disulfide interchange protein
MCRPTRQVAEAGPLDGQAQAFLAIPMAASGVAALWLLERQAGQRGLVIGAVLSLGLLIAAFVSGSLQRRQRAGAWIAPLPALLLGIGIALMPPRAAQPTQSPVQRRGASSAFPQISNRAGPVFVYFTADWCLTCKVNEAAAIDSAQVRDAFRKANVEVLAGDWTNGDPAITRFLESRGRAGVPYYLWYVPGKSPEELPQVLTAAMLISKAEAPRG